MYSLGIISDNVVSKVYVLSEEFSQNLVYKFNIWSIGLSKIFILQCIDKN